MRYPLLICRAVCAAALSLGCTQPAPAGNPPPPAPSESAVTPGDPIEARVSKLLSAMTLEEKLAYIGGDRGFYIRPIERLGIPEIKFSDGPAGCRNWGPSTAYPAPLGVTASFDPELAGLVGAAMARDCRARGVHVLLAPGVNLQRAPLNGRNFEYMGEDPHLAAQMATSFIRGVQGEGVLATVKHFVANNQEWDRNHISSEVDERTLREIYFPAFEAAVRDAQVGAVMTAYNLVNGTYASHDPWLTETVLRKEWGFSGVVMSDWGAVHDTVGAFTAGCDLEMPSGEFMNAEKLIPLLEAGKVKASDLDEKVGRILRTMIRAGFLDGKDQRRPDLPLDDPQSRDTALLAARETLVLLENRELKPGGKTALPLDPDRLSRIAVVGPNAHPAVHGGAGSSYVTPFSSVSVLDALKRLVPKAKVSHHPGVQETTPVPVLGAPIFSGPVRQEIFQGRKLAGKPVSTTEVDRIAFHPSGKAPAPGVGGENYSVRWIGKIRVAKAGRYALIANTDDGVRVWADGKKVIDDWSDHPPRANSAELDLRPGDLDIKVEYYQGVLGAVAELGFGPVAAKRTFAGAEELTRTAKQADVAIVCVGYGQSADTNSFGRAYRAFWPPDWAREGGIAESENSDRPFALAEAQLRTLRLVAKANARTIVVLNSGGAVDPEGWLDDVQALIWAGYPGQEGGTAVAEVLLGQTNPSGKLPFTFARRFGDYPSAPYYHLNDHGKTPYTEGILAGYRGFDAQGTEPSYPFGYGLSYARFEYSALAVEPTDEGGAHVSFEVKNTASRAGAEVAQLYVVPPSGGVARAPRALAGFARVELEPGQSRPVQMLVSPRAFSYWKGAWTHAPGDYVIEVGGSSRQVALRSGVKICRALRRYPAHVRPTAKRNR